MDPFLGNFDTGALAAVKREDIYQHLRRLGDPTKMYPGLLLLFPLIYRLEVTFDFSDVPRSAELSLEGGATLGAPVVWDSGQQPSDGQYREDVVPLGKHGQMKVRYQLRAGTGASATNSARRDGCGC